MDHEQLFQVLGEKPKETQPFQVECLNCHQILISKHRHHLVACSCPNGAFVDGGDTYARYGAKDMDMLKISPE